MVNIGNSWDKLLEDEFSSDYYQKLRVYLAAEYDKNTVYPNMKNIFNALVSTPYEKVKVVILGQDPYHGEGQAHGLCFSVQEGVKPPPSLVNIFKEIFDDVGIKNQCGCLEKWAKQGVLLLNTVLTVRAGEPNSHSGQGWEKLTNKIISLLNDREKPIVFLLWGANARNKKSLITAPQHLVLEAAHPSPLSAYAGFMGCKHFSKANAFLEKNNETAIDWSCNSKETIC
ncbi:MAG TPA: uracil-DNA glycosylase [Clostridia bacterium]|nr:uracil-DNA glycosylase [Clostridia bacterium]